jgi:branched-chain amino acid transport system permease protein
MFYIRQLEITLNYTIFVISIFPLTGLTGLFSLGQGAFIVLGAYTAAISYLQFGVPPVISIFFAVIVGVMVGVLIGLPTLRLRRDYFLLITFGFSEMVRGLLLWTAQLTGGAMGIAGIPKFVRLPTIGISVVILLFFISNLKKTQFGKTCIAIKNDEVAAAANGINVYAHKIKVFTLSSAISAYAGALYAFNIMFIEPNLFNWIESAKLIIIVFVGGLNSLTGVFISAIIYYTFGEVFRFANVWRDVILGFLVILVILFREKGLFGDWEFSFRRSFNFIRRSLSMRRRGK